MSNQEIRKFRSIWTTLLWIGSLQLVLALLLSFVRPVSDLLERRPEYQEVLAAILAEDFFAATRVPTYLIGSMDARHPAYLDKPTEIKKIPNPDEWKQTAQSFKHAARFVVAVGVFSQESQVWYLFYRQNFPGEKPDQSSFNPKHVRRTFGESRMYGLGLKRGFALGVDVSYLEVQKLHWRSQDRLSLQVLYQNMITPILGLWNDQVPKFDEAQTIARLRAGVARPFLIRLWLVRLGWLPLSLCLILLAALKLFTLQRIFLSGRIKPLQGEIWARYQQQAPIPSFLEFLNSRDLGALEARSVERLRDLRRRLQDEAERRVRQEQIWQERVRQRLREEDLAAGLVAKREQALQREIESLSKTLLELVETSGWDDNLRELYDQANAPGLALTRRKRLLRQALQQAQAKLTVLQLGEQKAVWEPVEDQEEELLQDELAGVPEQQFLTLTATVSERLNITDLIPSDLDAKMVMAIVVSLIQPGTRRSRFGEHYLPGSTLKQATIRWCDRFTTSFDPQSWSRCLKWLTTQNVVMRHSKFRQGRTYSLAAKPQRGRTPNNQELIRRVVQFARESEES